jgi:hypothetical protein
MALPRCQSSFGPRQLSGIFFKDSLAVSPVNVLNRTDTPFFREAIFYSDIVALKTLSHTQDRSGK